MIEFLVKCAVLTLHVLLYVLPEQHEPGCDYCALPGRTSRLEWKKMQRLIEEDERFIASLRGGS